MTITYIALGSNLDNPRKQLQKAVEALEQLPDSKLLQVSSFYQNPAIGPKQPDFINAVAELETTLTPFELLHALHQIEQQQGRIRNEIRDAPRTLDLDIVLYGCETINEADLIIPHPRFMQRAFVLIPLYDIAPTLKMPDGKPLSHYIIECKTAEMRKID